MRRRRIAELREGLCVAGKLDRDQVRGVAARQEELLLVRGAHDHRREAPRACPLEQRPAPLRLRDVVGRDLPPAGRDRLERAQAVFHRRIGGRVHIGASAGEVAQLARIERDGRAAGILDQLLQHRRALRPGPHPTGSGAGEENRRPPGDNLELAGEVLRHEGFPDLGGTGCHDAD